MMNDLNLFFGSSGVMEKSCFPSGDAAFAAAFAEDGRNHVDGLVSVAFFESSLRGWSLFWKHCSERISEKPFGLTSELSELDSEREEKK